MPNDVMLDTLVKLAAAGTSGVCILGIAATGWLIHKADEKTPKEKYRMMRYYLLSTLGIALISAASGALNAKWNAEAIKERDQVVAAQADSLTVVAQSVDSLLQSSSFQAAARETPMLNTQAYALRQFARARKSVPTSSRPDLP